MEAFVCPMPNPGSITLLPRESKEKSPKLQRRFHGSPAKVWHLGRAFHRVPIHVCVMVGCRDIPVKRMGIHPIFAES